MGAIQLKKIRETVEEHFGLSIWSEKGEKGGTIKIDAKKIYVSIATELTSFSLQKIGGEINRTHSNVIHLRERAKELKEIDKEFYNNFLECFNKVPKVKQIEYLKEELKYFEGKCQRIKKSISKLEKLNFKTIN